MRTNPWLCWIFAVAPLVASCGGSDGAQGEPGEPGAKGEPGDRGEPGAKGDPGTAGQKGDPGDDGTEGMACWDANGNGVCDIAAEDVDGNGACDADDCRGPQGPMGATGATGPAGPTLFKRAPFNSQSVPAAGQPAAVLASLTFTPPVSGTARLAGRGFCNLVPTAGSNNQIAIAAGTSTANAFTTSNSDRGFVIVPSGSPNGLYQLGWTSESTMAVSAGTQYTVVLAGRHEAGNTTNDCSGTFTVEIFTGTLP